MTDRHTDCDACTVIRGAIARLRKIETAEGGFRHADPLATANNVIAAMQNEAQLALAELLPLVEEPGPIAARYFSMSCVSKRHRQCTSSECACSCHEEVLHA